MSIWPWQVLFRGLTTLGVDLYWSTLGMGCYSPKKAFIANRKMKKNPDNPSIDIYEVGAILLAF